MAYFLKIKYYLLAGKMENLAAIGENFVPPEFELSKLFESDLHLSIGIFGSRFSGKSTLIEYIYPQLKKKYDLIFWFCQSKAARIYKNIFKDSDEGEDYLYETYNQQLIYDLFKYQNLTENSLHILVIFDDMVSFKGVKWSDSLLQIFTRGRNSNISVIFSSQDDVLMAPTARRNLDYVFLLNMSGDGPDKIAKRWLVHKFTFQTELRYKSESKRALYLMDFYQHYSEDHGMLVIANREIGNKLFQYRTPNVKDISKKRKKETDEKDQSKD
jgi:hypothetical protein